MLNKKEVQVPSSILVRSKEPNIYSGELCSLYLDCRLVVLGCGAADENVCIPNCCMEMCFGKPKMEYYVWNGFNTFQDEGYS